MVEKARAALETFSEGKMTAIELRRWPGGATYGEILQLLSEAALPLPRAPVAGVLNICVRGVFSLAHDRVID
jgi:hypothetical protein